MSKEAIRRQVWESASAQAGALLELLGSEDFERHAAELGERAGQTDDLMAALDRWRRLVAVMGRALGVEISPLPYEEFKHIEDQVLLPMQRLADDIMNWNADSTLWKARATNPRASMQVVNASCSTLIARLWSADAQWQTGVAGFLSLSLAHATEGRVRHRVDSIVNDVSAAAAEATRTFDEAIVRNEALQQSHVTLDAKLKRLIRVTGEDNERLRSEMQQQAADTEAQLSRAKRTVDQLEQLAPGGGLSTRADVFEHRAAVERRIAARALRCGVAAVVVGLAWAIGALWLPPSLQSATGAQGWWAHAGVALWLSVGAVYSARVHAGASLRAASHAHRSDALVAYGMLAAQAESVGIGKEIFLEAMGEVFADGPRERDTPSSFVGRLTR